MANLEKLALIEAIKKQTSQTETPPEAFDKIIAGTDVLQIVKWVFEMDDTDEEVREMKGLACFICVNLAMSSEASVMEML